MLSVNLAYIKNENRANYLPNAEEKREQSERAKARNEAKRKAEQASAYGQAPVKKGTVSSAARTSESVTMTSGASSSTASLQSQLTVHEKKLASGRNGTVNGTSKSFDTDVLNGKKGRHICTKLPIVSGREGV